MNKTKYSDKKTSHVIANFMKNNYRFVRLEGKHGSVAFITQWMDTIKVEIEGGPTLRFDCIPFENVIEFFLDHGYLIIGAVNVDKDKLLPSIKKNLR